MEGKRRALEEIAAANTRMSGAELKSSGAADRSALPISGCSVVARGASGLSGIPLSEYTFITVRFLVSTTRFLSNEALWQALTESVRKSQHVDAAIAYLGQGGAKLLPLRRGDRIVVDMSRSTVQAGSTDPREIEKLMHRGAQAFTRRSLHAKLIVADKSVIAGSANVSQSSLNVLEEAAIWTNDAAAIRRGRNFIDRLCTEPIRPEYLELCKQLYKPPKFGGQNIGEQPRNDRVKRAKLWLVSLVDSSSIPEGELRRYERGAAKAEKLIKKPSQFKIENFHWPTKPKMAGELEPGDSIIQLIKHKDKSISVSPPGGFLFVDHYTRDKVSGKERWVFHLELPKRGQALDWKTFTKSTKLILGAGALSSPRTKPIRDEVAADRLLSLWTPGGRVSRF